MRKKLAVMAAAVICGVAAVALPATPAFASTPQCNIAIVWQNRFVPGNDDGPFTPSCIMGRGAVSNAVSQLQSSLNQCYGKSLTVDRIFGSLTETALRQVQAAVNANPDGVYGPETARKMLHRVNGGGCGYITF
jgi:hypothetical protein